MHFFMPMLCYKRKQIILFVILCGGLELNYEQLTKQIIDSNNGIAKLSTLIAEGIPREKIYEMYSTGYLQRVSQGYYKIAEGIDFTDEEIIASTIPVAVISMESALFHYGYSDLVPKAWSITVPRTASRKLNTSVPIKIYYVTDEIYDIGKTKISENDTPYYIYDRERTICDMFKHRGKIDSELFCKAVKAYANDSQKNLRRLSEYAKKLRVYNKVTDLMEVLLND